MDKNTEMVIGLTGLTLLIVGVGALAGWPWAATITGGILFITAVANN